MKLLDRVARVALTFVMMNYAAVRGLFALRRGREVCHVLGTLTQHGKEVATAVAVCKVIQG